MRRYAAYVLPSASLREESVEGIINTSNSLVRGHLPIGLNAVLEAEELPETSTQQNKKKAW